MLENRRLVNSGVETPGFPRRKSGVRVSSAPPLDSKARTLTISLVVSDTALEEYNIPSYLKMIPRRF